MLPPLSRFLAHRKLRRATTPKPFEVLVTSKPQPWHLTLKELWQGRDLFLKLVRKEILVQYKQAVLGVLWILLRPLVTVAIFATIFRYILRFPAGDTPYAVFVMCGIVPWLYFSDAIGKGIISLQSNAHIITRIYFPRVFLPLSVVTAPLVDLVISIFSLFLVMFLYGLTPPPQIVFLPFFLLLIYLLALALSMLLAGPQAIFRDVGIIFKFVITMWLYLTPIIYPLEILPSSLQKILIYNPLTGIVVGLRWSVIGYGELPVDALVVSVATTAVLFVVGMNVFRRFEAYYVDQV